MRLDEVFDEHPDAEHFDALRKTGFFGAAGAGCIFLARDTGRILIAHRSEYVQEPNTWGVWGGAINRGEDPLQAVQREAHEETGNGGPFEFVPLYVFQSGTFRYFNFLCIVDEEFSPHLDWETQGFKWCEWGDWPQPMHFGLKALLSDHDSADKIMSHIHEFKSQIDEDYGDDEYVAPSDEIVAGYWIDVPHRSGFKDRKGIYLIGPGTNVAYGNYRGGFKSEADAEAYNREHLDGRYQVKVNAVGY